MTRFILTAVVATALGLAGSAQAATIVDFGGTGYVNAITPLPDGTDDFAGGTDGKFLIETNGSPRMLDEASGDEIDFNFANKTLVLWAAEDVVAGGTNMVFNLTGLSGSDTVVFLQGSSVEGDNQVPATHVVVKVGGVWYASFRSKTNGNTKTFNAAELTTHGSGNGFRKLNPNLSFDNSMTLQFSELTQVEAIGLLIDGDQDRNLRNFEAYGEVELIPEPASVALLAMGGLLLARRRHG